MNTTAKQRLRSFLNSLTTSQRSAFAKRCGASVGHLRNMTYEGKNPSGALAVAIDRESGGAVSFAEMCPDIDWKHVEAVINRRNRRVRASLPEK